MTRNRLAALRTTVLALALLPLVGSAAHAGGIVITNTTVTTIGDPQYRYKFKVDFKPGTVLAYGDKIEIFDVVGIDKKALQTIPTGDFASDGFSFSIKPEGTVDGVPEADVIWTYVLNSQTTIGKNAQHESFGVETHLNKADQAILGDHTNLITMPLSYTNTWGPNGEDVTTGTTTPQLKIGGASVAPEPATAALGALGLGLVGLVRATRRRASAP